MGHHQRGAEAFLRRLAPGFAHGLQAVAVLEQAYRSSGHPVHVAHLVEQPGHAVVDQLRHSTHARGYGGNLARHRLQSRQAKGLQFAGHQHQVGQREQLVDPLLLAQEANVALNSQVVRQPLGRRALRPVAHQHQPRRNLARHLRKDLHHVHHPFDRPEVGEMHQNCLAGRGQMTPRRGPRSLVFDGLIQVAVDEVRNHLDGPRHAEVLHCFLLEVLGDAGHAVALLDGVAGNGQVAAVQAYQRDVGAVQGSDEGQPAAARGQHLARQQRTDRVRNGVVHMQQVKFAEFSHFGHPRGQRQVVGRELEERVAGDRNLVVMNAVVAPA